jgi:hypothetical protein
MAARAAFARASVCLLALPPFLPLVFLFTLTLSAATAGADPSRRFAQATGSGSARAAIENELVIQTPMSAFVADAMLKEFAQYAREKWGVNLRTRVPRAGTPVSHRMIVGWKGQPEADAFWGGEPALFGDLAAQKLLARLELPGPLWDSVSVPPSIGSPKPIPLKGPGQLWLEIYGIAYNPENVFSIWMRTMYRKATV